MKSLLKIIILSWLGFGFFSCQNRRENPSIKNLFFDRAASHKIEKKQYEEALNLYFKILETDSDLPEVHSNIGNLFLLNKKNDEGQKSLQEALRLAEKHQDKKNEFIAHYNLGVYFGSLKEIPEALKQYQAALDIVPASKETKTNIELLIQDGSSSNKSKEDDKKDQKKGEGDSKDKKDGKDQDKKDNSDQKSEKDKKDEKDQGDKKDQEVKQNAKYKPRPYQGDQLSEGDVKKILGELKNQEQKIRANFDKKERKENKNEKDW